MEILTIVSIVFLVLLAGFFSGFEMGLISCNKIKISHLVHHGNRRAKHVQKFLKQPEKFLGVTLIATNILLIVATVFATEISANFFKGAAKEALATSLILTPIVLIFGELLPKAVFRQYADRLTLTFIYILEAFYYLLFPFVFVATRIGVFVSNLFGSGKFQKSSYITREEIRLLIREEVETKDLFREDLNMAYKILDFKKTPVKAVMVPLIDVVASPAGATVTELANIVEKTHYSRLPIYEGRLDNIVGVVHMVDLMIDNQDLKVFEIMRVPYFVPETNSIEKVLNKMQENREFMAIVVDEYGGISGIVTLEDIIEEIVGEIEDEYDMHIENVFVREKDFFIVDGKLPLEKFNEETGLMILKDGVGTIAGFIMAISERIPGKGEKITYDGIQFEILEATNRSVERVKIKKVSA